MQSRLTQSKRGGSGVGEREGMPHTADAPAPAPPTAERRGAVHRRRLARTLHGRAVGVRPLLVQLRNSTRSGREALSAAAAEPCPRAVASRAGINPPCLLCYAVLFCAMLCLIMLYYGVLCYVVLCCIVLCCIMVCHATPCEQHKHRRSSEGTRAQVKRSGRGVKRTRNPAKRRHRAFSRNSSGCHHPQHSVALAAPVSLSPHHPHAYYLSAIGITAIAMPF